MFINALLLLLPFILFAGKRLLTYLHIYQQEEYDSPRFARWLWAKKAFDKRLSLHLVLAALTVKILPLWLVLCATGLGFLVVALREKDPRKASKKKLVMTARAKRIFFIAWGLSTLSALWVFFTPTLLLVYLVNIHLIPVWLMVANALLAPHEARTQKKFWQEAHDKVRDIKPVIMGITGSFGKTSVKHILGHILNMQAPTLITPGSVNTPMGITRIIRERLESRHRYFVVEMGAYGKGSIARLCALTPPRIGIITAIGQAHYERFKTLDTVAEAKYELAEDVFSRAGKMIVHDTTTGFPAAQSLITQHPEAFVLCGENAGDALTIVSVTQNAKGLDIALDWHGAPYTLTAPLYGTHHGGNIALAFATAMTLGLPAADIQTALLSLPQIQHRLEVKPQADGTTLIDDAYNSNPVGFASALELLPVLAGERGRKILVTPGMVELGEAHDTAHEAMGRKAGAICDIVLLVASDRIPSFIKGFKETGGDKPLHTFPNFSTAQEWLLTHKQAGDVILLENDLPDVYEAMLRI